MSARILFALLAVSFTACGSGAADDDDTPDAAADQPDAAESGGPDGGGLPGDFVPLITGTWSIPAGDELYHCARKTVEETMYIAEFRPIIPLGTHHTVLTIDNPDRPDGEYACSVIENGTKRGLYGTGIGANKFTLPDGVAMKLSPGEQLVLNLHLYNTNDSAPLTGTSGTEVRLIDPGDVVHEGDSDLVGKIFGLTVVPGESMQTANCSVSREVTLFALSPHMHQLGVYAKAVLTPAGGGDPVTLHDGDYSFENQLVYMLPEPLTIHPGDTIRFDCSYDNQTGSTVYFGDSSDAEMCFLGVYYYPSGSFAISCN